MKKKERPVPLQKLEYTNLYSLKSHNKYIRMLDNFCNYPQVDLEDALTYGLFLSLSEKTLKEDAAKAGIPVKTPTDLNQPDFIAFTKKHGLYCIIDNWAYISTRLKLSVPSVISRRHNLVDLGITKEEDLPKYNTKITLLRDFREMQPEELEWIKEQEEEMINDAFIYDDNDDSDEIDEDKIRAEIAAEDAKYNPGNKNYKG